MTHSHDHHHHGGHDHSHSHAPATFGRAFAIGIVLNTTYVAAEAIWGVRANSLALLSDAGHNFGDVLSLGVAWLASVLGGRAPSGRYTYGLRGSSILAALSNAVLLMLVTGGIVWAAVLRLVHPSPAASQTVMLVAAGGIAVNALTAWLFASGRKADVNIRAAFQHMAYDALVAMGVVIAGGAMLLTGWLWLDPVVSLIIAAIIVWGTWSLMRESLDLALNAVPSGVDSSAVRAFLSGLPGVTEVHDLHIWGMSTTETALTAHLVRPSGELDDALLHQACAELRSRFAVHHSTLQIERGVADHPCVLAAHDSV